jgi:hypothetical protein
MPENEAAEALRTAYDQLCISYRAIDDFRAKLLGFLPLVTGGGIVVLTGGPARVPERYLAPIGLFGLAVTVGLLAYELFGIRKCHAVILVGVELEREMGLPRDAEDRPAGQFGRRPPSLLGIVNEPFAAAAIYPAVLGAWAYLAFDSPATSLVTFIAGFLSILGYCLWLRFSD